MMQEHPHVRHAAWMRASVEAHFERHFSAGSRLSVWLVVGNAGALVLLLQTAMDGHACHTSLLAATWLFAAGLIVAFAGRVVNYWSSWQAGRLLDAQVKAAGDYELALWRAAEADRNDDVEERVRAKQQGDAAHARYKAQSTDQANRIAVASLGLTGLSAILFAAGVLTPVANAAALAHRCLTP